MADEQITGGAAIATRMVEDGCRTVFSLAGAGHTQLLLPLEAKGVHIVGVRHETGAVGGADGYARTTGGLGFALIIAEQGLPNAITPIATAFQAGSPVVVLVTRFPESWVEATGEFVVDHHAMLLPITKWVRTVPNPGKLVEYFDAACRVAQEGRPGPVVLVIPQDFLAAPVKAPTPRRATVLHTPAADAGGIDDLAERLAAAERPVLVIDSHVGAAAAAPLGVLAHAFGVPVFGYGAARGLVPEDDRISFPWPYAQPALKTADLAIVAGARLGMWFGFGRAPRFPDALSIVQIDQEAHSGRNRPVASAITADPAKALAQLTQALQRIGMARKSTAWLDEALEARRAETARLAKRGEARLHTLELLAAISARRPAGGVLVGDGADILNFSYGALRVSRPGGYMDHHPMGSMGVGLPLAIGAAAAERDLARAQGRAETPTTLVTGDGAVGFYLAELHTAARERLPLKVIVAVDGLWGTEFHGQSLVAGRTVNTALGYADYARAAEALGCAAFSATTPDQLALALDAAFAHDGPALVDVRIDPEAGMGLKRDPRLSFLIFSDLAPPNA